MPTSNKLLVRSAQKQKNAKKGALVKRGSKQISKTNQGEDVAKRMREKMTKMKVSKKADEIDSDRADGEGEAWMDSDDEQKRQSKLRQGGAVTADLVDDPFFASGQELDENETAEEKRLRMTKKLIQQLGEEQKDQEKDDFFMNLQANTTTDVNIISEEDDRLKKALKYKILE